MQLYARRPTDQWRGFAALDDRNSYEPATRYNSARSHPAWGHQHRSDNGGHANAEYVGMRREHDDESGNARHDGTGQRHGRRGNAGRIGTARLLMETANNLAVAPLPNQRRLQAAASPPPPASSHTRLKHSARHFTGCSPFLQCRGYHQRSTLRAGPRSVGRCF